METNANKRNAKEQQNGGNWKVGVSSGLGAAAGVMFGNAAQTVVAAELNQDDPLAGQEGIVSVEEPVNVAESEDVKPEEPVQVVTPVVDGPHTEELPPMTVVSHETVVTSDGIPMDVAILSNNGGEEVALLDVDFDGMADAAIRDLNGDGIVTEDEIVDLTAENVQMPEVNDMVDPVLLASNDTMMPDYTNNADVSEFMA